MSSIALSTRALDALVKEYDQFGNTIMSLNDIGLDGYIRYKRYEDGPRFSEIDVVKIATGKSTDSAGLLIRRLSDEVRSEVRSECSNLKFKGPGQKETILITFQGAMKLLMALPGINAREIRTKFSEKLQRYFAGDLSLVGEIVANNQSNAPIPQLAREDLGVQQVAAQQITTGLIKEMAMEVYKEQQKEEWEYFNKRRRLQLYDARTKEMRLEKDHKRNMAVHACVNEQKKLELDVEKQKTVTVDNERKKIKEEEESRLKTIKEEEESKLRAAKEELEMKRLNRKEEKEHEIELLKLKEQMREKSPQPTVNVNVNNNNTTTSSTGAAVPNTVTVESVAEMFKIFEDIQNRSVQMNILKVVGSMLVKDPFNLQPVGKKPSQYTDKYEVNEFPAEDERIIMKQLVRARDQVLKKAGGGAGGSKQVGSMDKFFK
jgi:hypothetical protein